MSLGPPHLPRTARSAVARRRACPWPSKRAILGVVCALAAPAANAGVTCVGDCDGNGQVAINELIVGVNIALDLSNVAECRSFDVDGNGAVSVDELIRAVNVALAECTAMGTATFTATASSTGTEPFITPTPTDTPPVPTPTVTATPRPGDVVSGACTRPRPGAAGLVPCDAGTIVRAFRCDNRFTCASGPAGRTQVGQGPVNDGGAWSFGISPPVAPDVLLAFEASIEASVYRVLDLGAAGAGGAARRGVAIPGPSVSPISEASVRILDGSGLGNFPDEGLGEVGAAVAAANANETFANQSPAGAAERAEQNARGSAQVADAVMQNKSGRICDDTVWRAEASPFVVVQSVIVGGTVCPAGRQDVTLTIEPGVEVRFRGNLFLQVRSTLIARGGTGQAQIVFTSDADIPRVGDWNGIRFEDSATDAVLSPQGDYVSGSILENVTVEYAEAAAATGVVTLNNAVPLLQNLTLRNNRSTANGILVASITDATVLRLKASHIVSNEGPAFVVGGGSPDLKVEITNTEISHNSSGFYVGSGNLTLVVADSLLSHNDGTALQPYGDMTIRRTEVSDNGGFGIFTGSGRLVLRESTIRNNAGVGLVAVTEDIQVLDNLVSGNLAGGMDIEGGGGGCDVRRNCVTMNAPDGSGGPFYVSPQCGVASNTVIGDVVLPRSVASGPITQNNLLGEPIALQAPQGLSPPDLDASGNYWGTGNADAIPEVIRDCSDPGGQNLTCVITPTFSQVPIASAPDIDACREGRLE